MDNLNSCSCQSAEEEDMANCLMMLSNSTADDQSSESATSKEEQEIRRVKFKSSLNSSAPILEKKKKFSDWISKGMFECKACKKTFSSHQALGGHRASHKKVKGCFAARVHQVDRLADQERHDVMRSFDQGTSSNITTATITITSSTLNKKKSKVHRCSICNRVFSSGQALGGHKRCHWIMSNSLEIPTLSKLYPFDRHDEVDKMQQRAANLVANSEPLDLNFPALADQNPVSLRREVAEQLVNNIPSHFGVSTQLFLQSGIGVGERKMENDNNIDGNNYSDLNNYIDGEAESRVKLGMLSEAKDVSSGSSSSWLQVGIGSPTDMVVEFLSHLH